MREMPEDAGIATITEWCERDLPPSVARPARRGTPPRGRSASPRTRRAPGRDRPQVAFLWGFDAPEYEAALLSAKLGGDARGRAQGPRRRPACTRRRPRIRVEKRPHRGRHPRHRSTARHEARQVRPCPLRRHEGPPQGIPLFDSSPSSAANAPSPASAPPAPASSSCAPRWARALEGNRCRPPPSPHFGKRRRPARGVGVLRPPNPILHQPLVIN